MTAGGPPDAQAGVEPDPRGLGGLLADRTFGPYLAGNLLSNTGNWFQNVAAGLLVFAVTGSNTLVGVVGVLQFGATLLLSPVAGAVADRVDRRRLLLGAQVLGAAGALGLALLVLVAGVDGLPGVWPVFVATAVIGTGYAIGLPTLQALVPSLVPPADLDRAIALNSISFTLARAVGPALAGVVVAVAGTGTAFAVNALSFLPLVGVLLVIRPRPVVRDPEADRSLRAGLRYVRTDSDTAVLLLATITVGFATDPVNTLAPAFADLLDQGPAFVGFVGAAFGGGAVVATPLGPRLRDRLGPAAPAPVGLVGLAVGMSVLALAPHPAVALTGLVLAGMGFLVAISSINTAVQRRVPDALRGRVMALWSAAFLGSRPLAAPLDGAVADLTSPRLAVLVTAALPVVAAVWLHRRERVSAGARI